MVTYHMTGVYITFRRVKRMASHALHLVTAGLLSILFSITVKTGDIQEVFSDMPVHDRISILGPRSISRTPILQHNQHTV